MIDTFRGPIDAEQLGVTLMHEHVFVLSPEIQQNWPTNWDTEEAIVDAVARLDELYGVGVRTIVDLTVVGLGRDAALVKRVADQVDINIVAATGLYTYDTLPHFFDYRGPRFRGGVDQLEDYFRHDIENGISGTGVRPGILKCATDKQGVTPDVERVLRSVAKVHRLTGIPISTHTDAHSERGLEQQAIFDSEGVDLTRVVIGHSGDSTDIEYLEKLLRAGSTLGMDRFGIDVYCRTEDRIETVAKLCERGWSNQLVLSHDAACHMDWFDPELLEKGSPNWNYLHISRDVLPRLRERGVSDDDINAMLVEAPRRILDHGPKY